MSLEREQLLSHGVAVLAREGLDLDLSRFRIDEAAAACAVDPATARSLWATPGVDPNVAFGRAVIIEVLQRQLSDAIDRSFVTEMVDVLTRSLDRASAGAEIAPTQRRSLIQDLCRSAADVAVELPQASQSWRAFVVISTLVFAHPDANEWLVEAWKENQVDTTPRLTNLYSAVPAIFGMKLRYCYSWEQLLVVMSSVGEGLIMRAGSLGDAGIVERATGPDGAIEQWPLLAVAAEAVFHQFFEPIDPDETAPLLHEAGPEDDRS